MKKFITLSVLAIMIATGLNVYADEKEGGGKTKDNPPETLFGGNSYSLSGYGAPFYRFSRAGEAYGSFVGGRGGFIINDRFVFGAAGMGLAYPRKREDISGNSYTGLRPYIGMGYGGGLMEYYFSPKSVVHFSAGVLIGGGSLMLHDRMNNDNNRRGSMRSDSFFATEPEINLFVNVTRFFRAGVGVSYRYVRGISSNEISDRDFRGPAGSVILAFGWF